MKRDIYAFKKAVINEKIAKYNHFHDEFGKFTTAEGAVALDSGIVDGLKGMTKVQKEMVKSVLDVQSKNLSEADERLGIDAKQAFSYVCAKVRDEISNKDNPIVKRYKKDKCGACIEIAKTAYHEVIREYEKEYCQDKLGENVDINASYAKSTRVLDFIDGASWVKENIGVAHGLTAIYGEHENYEKYQKSLSGSATAGTTSDKNGTCHFILGSEDFDSVSDSLEMHSQFHPKGFSFSQIGAHEYTHAIEDSIHKEICDTYFGGNEEVLRNLRVSGEVSEYVMKTALEKCNVHGDRFTSMSDSVSQVSSYASSNSSEAMAECVSDCYSNREEAAEISKAVLETLKSESSAEDIYQAIKDVPWYRDRISG